jgi:Family of unknown function (DUF6152)
MKLAIGITVLTLTIGATPVLAHHSAAMFDHTKKVTLEGNVKEFQYTNPHSWLQVVGRGSDGKVQLWGFEAEGPSTLLRAGIKASTFKPGDKVTIVFNPMKDGRPAGALVTATKADGTVFSPRPSAQNPG